MLRTRIITALILAPSLLLVALFAREGVAGLVIAVVLGVAGWEWANLARWRTVGRAVYAALIVFSGYGFATLANYYPMAALALYGFNLLCWIAATMMIVRYPRDVPPMEPYRWRISIIGFAILVPLGVAIWQLYRIDMVLGSYEFSGIWLVFSAAIPILADAGAYFIGRAWGKAKLAPRVSPNKTWAGFWGGVCIGAIVAGMGAWFMPGANEQFIGFVLLGVFAAVISVVGDLTVSLFKRHAGVKDTGSILPGHGGIMDRVDSIAAALPILAGGYMLLELF